MITVNLEILTRSCL